MSGYQYRVSWRRQGWNPKTGDRFKLFGRQCDAEAFITDKLLGAERPELRQVIVTRTCRPVGDWVEGWPS